MEQDPFQPEKKDKGTVPLKQRMWGQLSLSMPLIQMTFMQVKRFNQPLCVH